MHCTEVSKHSKGTIMKKTFFCLGIMALCALASTPAFANEATKESCPAKTLGKYTLEGKYVKETPHEGYYGFLVQGNDGKSYDIGIGNDTHPSFEGIKAGNSIKIPYYTRQFFDEATKTCVVEHHLDYENDFKGSYSK